MDSSVPDFYLTMSILAGIGLVMLVVGAILYYFDI